MAALYGPGTPAQFGAEGTSFARTCSDAGWAFSAALGSAPLAALGSTAARLSKPARCAALHLHTACHVSDGQHVLGRREDSRSCGLAVNSARIITSSMASEGRDCRRYRNAPRPRTALVGDLVTNETDPRRYVCARQRPRMAAAHHYIRDPVCP